MAPSVVAITGPRCMCRVTEDTYQPVIGTLRGFVSVPKPASSKTAASCGISNASSKIGTPEGTGFDNPRTRELRARVHVAGRERRHRELVERIELHDAVLRSEHRTTRTTESPGSTCPSGMSSSVVSRRSRCSTAKERRGYEPAHPPSI